MDYWVALNVTENLIKIHAKTGNGKSGKVLATRIFKIKFWEQLRISLIFS